MTPFPNKFDRMKMNVFFLRLYKRSIKHGKVIIFLNGKVNMNFRDRVNLLVFVGRKCLTLLF
jgi:hypothetical protein